MATGHLARQVIDFPESQPLIVTEHRAHGCLCAACGAQTRAAFPEGVAAPVQYGKRIAAFVPYLLHYQLLSGKRLAALMAELFGVHLVTATIARISQDCAELSRGFADTIRDRVAAAPVKHVDETGFRIGGETQRLHNASAVWLTFHRVSPRRASLLAHATGIAVHDHWKPYYTLKGVLHAPCNAHHLRELKALVKIEREDWARKMQRLRRRACHATNLAREQGVAVRPGSHADPAMLRRDPCRRPGVPSGPARADSRRGQSQSSRPGRGRSRRLPSRRSVRKQAVMRFLTDPRVPSPTTSRNATVG